MDAADAAAHFIVRRAEGLTASEQTLLESWLADDPAHAAELERAERGWNAFDSSGGDEILEAMRAHARTARAARSPLLVKLGAAAAALLILISSAILFRSIGPVSPGPGAAAADFTYASARGAGVKEVRLPDGSLMSLDADSEVKGRFSDAARSLTLVRGRAYFAVATDRNRPFAVRAGDYRAVAIGTRFSVDLAGAALSIELVEGRLEIGPVEEGAEPRLLLAGQRFSVRAGRPVVTSMDDPAALLRWKSGMLTFEDQTLSHAVAIVNRYSNRQVVIDDPAIGTLRVSGSFKAGEPDRFASAVAELHGLRTRRTGAEIHIVTGT